MIQRSLGYLAVAEMIRLNAAYKSLLYFRLRICQGLILQIGRICDSEFHQVATRASVNLVWSILVQRILKQWVYLPTNQHISFWLRYHLMWFMSVFVYDLNKNQKQNHHCSVLDRWVIYFYVLTLNNKGIMHVSYFVLFWSPHDSISLKSHM